MAALSDEELQAKTPEFKQRLADGETLDDLLPEAFAAMCEADKRVLGMFPFDVQIMGGIVLHRGELAEMCTGEGKTLVATLPLYLNALSGESAILVTTNDYLARRDAEEMGPAYEFMGLSVAAGVPENPEESFEGEEKKAIYACDIVYTTHGTLGFDYLFNNLVKDASERFLRELSFIIIDEADAVLLDSAQTPLVISGAPRVQSNLYAQADFFVSTLREGEDYELEDHKVWFTHEGSAYAEEYFNIPNFYAKEYFEINRHVTLALRAHTLFKKGEEYVVSEEGEIILLDRSSGRKMPGVKLRGGQHQALEEKEKLHLTNDNRSVASVTYQNFFRLFKKMSGMSGTIYDARRELWDVYQLKVVPIPTNNPIARIDMKDNFYQRRSEQLEAAMNEVERLHESGRPVLVVATTIAETEEISQLLIHRGVPHNVLNANNAYWEASIIKEAGQLNAVTVATSMAGRGTDIKLPAQVRELGGLAVIGIGRLENIRLERQARGRAGRQGDPGSSLFFVCLEDELVKSNARHEYKHFIEGSWWMPTWMRKHIINTAQRAGEDVSANSRNQSMEYDQVMRSQRHLIYDARNRLLDGEDLSRKQIHAMVEKDLKEFYDTTEDLTLGQLRSYLLYNISYRANQEIRNLPLGNYEQVSEHVHNLVSAALEHQEDKLGTELLYRQFIRTAALQAVDDAWVDQVDYLQQLQSAVSGRSTAQRNVIYEYQDEALIAFKRMEKDITRNIVRNILLSVVGVTDLGQLDITYP